MSLARYHAKRTFESTPEPRGVEFATTQQRFVIQKHDATNLHYDLRLEHKGVMLSWAVPKGPSEDPTVRHLAAQTEDHPLEYRHFEGVIPSGYGAGTVMVWDFGTFEWVERHRDRLSFILYGTKLRGEYALIRFKRAGSNSWLLLKKRDRFAKRRSITKLKPDSAVTGRSLTQIEQGHAIKRAFIKALPGAKAAALPRSIAVMKPTLVAKPFSDADWLFEKKWDGFRGIAYIDGKKLRVVSRNGLDLLERFPEIARLSKSTSETGSPGLAAHKAVLDGEIIAVDKRGIGRFEGLKSDVARKQQIVYQAFDLLYLDGFNLRSVPLLQRKALLRAIVLPHTQLFYTDHIEAAGEQFFADVTKEGHEGMVAKERESVYESGRRTRTWLKIKKNLGQEVVIGGWQYGQGAREKFVGSLMLGVYEGKQLIPIGRVGSGFDQQELEMLTSKLKRLAITRSPFAKPVHHRGVQFVKPILVAQVKFEEWTSDGQLRQPVYLGLRHDKKATEVVREVPRSVAVSTQRVTRSVKVHAAKKVQPLGVLLRDKNKATTVVVQGAELSLTNLSKPFWSRPRIVKRDVINYYHAIAPVVLPYLKDRPLTLKRYPNGATGGFFYQKNAPDPHPRFVKTVRVMHSDGPTRYVVCNDLKTLIWLANLADLELHPWYSRVGQLDHPDFVVFDLDPTKPNDLASVREVALLIKEVLDYYKLEGFAKSSGSRGIHIYVPIAPRFTYDQTKAFAKRVTEVVHHLAPKQTTLEFRKAKRHGVYIDYLQNIKGKTLASVYSLRARPFAPVSAPISWDEIKRGFAIKDYTINNMVARVKKTGDLFSPSLTLKQNLAPALKKILKLPL